MPYPFIKMQGLGNDFVVIDACSQPLAAPLTPDIAKQIADRRCGIGCDQVLLISPHNDANTFTYTIYNANGSTAEQCGNGARCVGRYCFDAGLAHDHLVLEAPGGKMTVTDGPDGLVSITLPPPDFTPAALPFITEQAGPAYQLEGIEFGAVSIGNPHIIIFCEDAATAPLSDITQTLSQHEAFPQGINISCVQQLSDDQFAMRTIERGAGETLACGSAACAAAVVAQQLNKTRAHTLRMQVALGELTVSWTGEAMTLTGPADTSFTGNFLS